MELKEICNAIGCSRENKDCSGNKDCKILLEIIKQNKKIKGLH